MIDELTHGSELVRSARNQHERLAMSFACKAAIKAGQPLDAREIQELFDQLFATRAPLPRRPRASHHGAAFPGGAGAEVRAMTPPAPGTGPVAGRPVLAVVGPTASGKTALSLPLAEALGGRSSRWTPARSTGGWTSEPTRCPGGAGPRPHHGLDLVDPRERYSAGRFARDARGWIEEIRARGHLPLLVGGTGFFLKALLEPVFREPPMDPDRPEALRRCPRAPPPGGAARWVRRLDPARAELARAGGPQRPSAPSRWPSSPGVPSPGGTPTPPPRPPRSRPGSSASHSPGGERAPHRRPGGAHVRPGAPGRGGPPPPRPEPIRRTPE
jgi:hypothetical protein